MCAATNNRSVPTLLAREVEALESRVLFTAGDLDALFASGGKVTLDYFTRNDFGNAVAVQSDSKVLVAGYVSTGTTAGNDFAIARFNPDGTLDTTFGTGGRVVTNVGSTTDMAFALAVQSDGKVVLAGSTRGSTSGNDFALVRYNPNGTLDNTFGLGGIVRTDMGGNTNDQANALHVMPDGRIVVAGFRTMGGQQQFAVARYTGTGLPDSTFGGGDGINVIPLAGGTTTARAVATLADGSTIVGGSLNDLVGSGTRFAAIKLTPDGSHDVTFGVNGFATANLGGTSELANAIVMVGGGRFVLVGDSTNGTSQDVALAAFTAAGQLDTSFGGGSGFVLTDIAGGADSGAAVALAADGKLVVAGSAVVGGLSRFAVLRYDADGSLDSTFGTGGRVSHPFTAGESFGKAVAIDGEGRIVIAGNVMTAGGTFDVGVMRLVVQSAPSNAAPTADPGGAYLVNAGGSVVLSGAGSADADGSIVAFEWDFDYDGNSFTADATGVSPTFSAAGIAGPAVRFVALRVTDDDGATSTIVATAVTINALPVASPGGPYFVNAGSTVALNGNLSGDADGFIVGYAWDFDYDGQTFGADATGATPTFSAAGLSGPASRTIALRVTDNRGAVHLATTTLTINALPVANAGGPYLVNEGASVALSGSASSDADGAIVSYEWDFDYDGTTFNGDATGAGATFSAAGLSGPATRTVALRVTDNRGAVHLATATVTINALPLANAGGAYIVNAGESIALDGSGSSDADGAVVSYEWDLDYDGATFNADATGATTTFSAAGLSGPAVRIVALRVTDDCGATHLVMTTVTINAKPTANPAGPYSVFAGQSVQVSGAGSGDADGSVVSYEWDFNYDGSTFHADATGATATFSAANVGPSSRTIALRVTDNHGATSIAVTTVTIALAPGSTLLVADPERAGGQMLLVQGTAGNDSLRLRSVRGGPVEVMLGNRSIGAFSGMTRVFVDGGEGNDVIDASDLSVPVSLFGGAGDDKLTGGSTHDVLVGGAGDDQLDGGAGDDVLIGGAGRDDLDARYGDDLMVGASLSFENDRAAMSAVLAEWTRTDVSLSQRIANLLNGGGNNGTVVLSGPSLVEDNAADALSGTEGADWWLTGTGDTVKKLRK